MTTSLDKLHGTVAVQLDSTLSSYASINLEKIHITIAIRPPISGVGATTGSSNASAYSNFLLTQEPLSDSSVGTWKNEAGGSVLYPSISKPAGINDATYIVAAFNVTDTAKVKLEPPTLEVGEFCYVDYRIGKSDPDSTQAVDVTVKLYQGVTLIASWSHPSIDGPMTSITQTLTAPQVAAISDYSNLFLEFVSTPI